jgi:hypothetical protein
LFNHEKHLYEEIGKLRVQLSVAEEAEKNAKKDAPESAENKEGEIKDVKTADSDSSPDTASTQPLTNGVHDKAKLVNGDTSVDVDSDSTAVNTPLGSSTPVPKSAATVPDVTETSESETIVLTADILRLQIVHLEKLLKFLEKEFAPTRQKLNDLLASNDMKFSLLWCLFCLGSVITFKDYESGLNMAGEVCPLQFSF